MFGILSRILLKTRSLIKGAQPQNGDVVFDYLPVLLLGLPWTIQTVKKQTNRAFTGLLWPFLTDAHNHAHLLSFIIRSSTDAVELLCGSLLCLFTLCAYVVVHLLRLLFRDAHAVTVVPVCAQITAYIKPTTTEGEMTSSVQFFRHVNNAKLDYTVMCNFLLN